MKLSRKLAIAIILLTLTLLPACIAKQADHTPQKVLSLSRGAHSHLTNDYQKNKNRAVFVTSETGRTSIYWWCSGSDCNTEENVENALTYCNNMELDGECQVLFLKDHQVAPVNLKVDQTLCARIVTPDKIKNLGPEKAKGVILYVPGYGAWVWPRSVKDCTAPNFLSSLNKRGFDVFKVNIPYYNMRPDMKEEIARYIATLPQAYFDKGYDKVAFLGQSRGAWSILQSTEYNDDTRVKYVFIAPAAHGSKEKSNNTLNQADSEFARLISRSEAQNALFFFFQNDGYAREKSPNRVKQKMSSRKNWHMVNKPRNFSGHGSMWSYLFDKTATNALEQFFTNGNFQWESVSPDYNEWTDFTTLEHIRKGKLKQIRNSQLKKVLHNANVYGPEREKNTSPWLVMRPDQTMTVNLTGDFVRGNTYEATWSIKGDDLRLKLLSNGYMDDKGVVRAKDRVYQLYLFRGDQYLLVDELSQSAWPIVILNTDNALAAN